MLLGLLLVPWAWAQDPPPQALRASAFEAPDLFYPGEPSGLSIFSGPHMALYKPEGDGPFPALVIEHQRGGLGDPHWQNMSILGWARAAVRSVPQHPESWRLAGSMPQARQISWSCSMGK